MEKIENSFQKSLQGLEEIQLLGGKDLTPLIANVSFHLAELKRTALETIDENQCFENLNNLLISHIESFFIEYIKQNNKLSQAQIYFSDKSWGNKEWNSILKIIPDMLSLMDLISFKKNVQLVQDKDVFKLRGWIGQDCSIEKKRTEIYSIFRNLLKHKTLLTYKIIETEKYDESILEIVFDLSHNENMRYEVHGDKGFGMIGFSNVFSTYEIKDQDKNPMFKHHILEINRELELNRISYIPENLNTTSKVIHFPFMFQPISFIIPNAGELKYREESLQKKNYIDLFDLIVESK
jgi:hypothetical protein